MIGLDTNILARYYIEREDEDIKTQNQREIAKRIIENSLNLHISNTVIIEFEWVLRGIYKFDKSMVIAIYENLVSLPNVHFENRVMVQRAIIFAKAGIEFTDAFHLASYQDCKLVYSFDDKGFAKKVAKNQFLPNVIVPNNDI